MTDGERRTDQDIFSEDNTGILSKRLMGDGKWQGQNPYHIELLDQKKLVAFGLDLRGGEDWITIQLRTSETLGVVHSYLLELKNGKWEYNDPYLAKYNESSLSQLETVFGLMKKAEQAFAPSEISPTTEIA